MGELFGVGVRIGSVADAACVNRIPSDKAGGFDDGVFVERARFPIIVVVARADPIVLFLREIEMIEIGVCMPELLSKEY